MKRLSLLLAIWTTSLHAQWIDHSHEIFLTKDMGQITKGVRDYPLFWWNFVIVDGQTDTRELCANLAQKWKGSLAKIPCHFDAAALKSLSEDWLADTNKRQHLPPDLELAMRKTLAKASLPLPSEFLPLLRADPLNLMSELKTRLEARVQFKLPSHAGIIGEGTRHMIPLQLNFAPHDSARSGALVAQMEDACRESPGCAKIALFGPHAGNFENEKRIRDDIGVVSVVGTLGLLLLAAFIFLTKRWRLILLLPILGVGVLLGAVTTILAFGSIHGITLAFGPGIIGLALDYGVHAAFLDPRARSTWRTNFAGLVTTLAILFILIFSAVPLLRQMMFFSIFGLCYSFALFFFFLRRKPEVFATKPYAFTPGTWRGGEWLALALLLAAPLVLFRPVQLSVQHLNYERPHTKEVREWFIKVAGSRNAYWVQEETADPLTSAHATKAWAAQNGMEYEGVAAFLPPKETQETHLTTWRTQFCPSDKLAIDATARKFFEPFIKANACAALTPKLDAPSYAADFTHNGKWISLLFAETADQIAALKARFPKAHTPREMFDAFPKIFMFELKWMVPLALLAAFGFLWRHFRKLKLAMLSVVPFLTGVGCYAVVATFLQLPLSFITLIGLLMVFGFSLDYGIFVVDLHIGKGEGKFGVWSALSVCSFATLTGFAPMVFAGHPVLNDLGHSLLWGSLGTFIGTYWGIPGLLRRFT